MEDKEKIAREICKKAKDAQLNDFQERMPDNKQGVQIEVNGVKYIAAIRRLTPQECAELRLCATLYKGGGNNSVTYIMEFYEN